ncbi:MAG: 23S rRNA (pseudouridine(1915)-N(3))-methyltransferase RlmH [Burkholderiales bacterium]|nr:23S rRNA (pseudouridine(1915)-N(3))-methyltransferase RlmH [Burkholderiales bacterium]
MKFTVIALGHKMPAWVQTGVEEYTRRMPPEARIEIVELKPEDRVGKSIDAVLKSEAVRIEAAIPRQAERLVLDERGHRLTTRDLAQMLTAWMREGISPCFIIGSADGLHASVKQSALRQFSLSGCTLPHGLVRVMLAEQLYRAWSLTQNHPYHRD